MNTLDSMLLAVFPRDTLKKHRAAALIILVHATLLTSYPALAQSSQQGPKLVGADAVGFALQGQSVAISADGNTAIVGGNDDNDGMGAAWVWARSGGVWTQQGPKLVGLDAVGRSHQGQAVALSADGNTAIVGGLGDGNGVGAAWIWSRSGGVWTQQGSKLVGTGVSILVVGGDAWQGFSVSLSADGNTAIVGGPNADTFAPPMSYIYKNRVGAAWIWTRRGGVWSEEIKLANTTGSTSQQGYSVSLSADGNTAIVGGEQVLLWTRDAGAWTERRLNMSGLYACVAISADGNTIVIGEYGGGSACVSTKSSEAWTRLQTSLPVSNRQPYWPWGVALSADGTIALVGGGGVAEATLVWTKSGGVWMQQPSKLIGLDTDGTAIQGWSVACSADGKTVIVGAPGDNKDMGAALVFVAAPNSEGPQRRRATRP